MEFDDIRAFVAVAEARSVSRAARELYLTACSASSAPSAWHSAIAGGGPSR